MTLDEAIKHLGVAVKADGRLYDLGWYLCFEPSIQGALATLDGQFTADDLEAIATYMRAHGPLNPKGTED